MLQRPDEESQNAAHLCVYCVVVMDVILHNHRFTFLFFSFCISICTRTLFSYTDLYFVHAQVWVFLCESQQYYSRAACPTLLQLIVPQRSLVYTPNPLCSHS